MKKVIISAFIAASFRLCAMENSDFGKIVKDVHKKIEERLTQGEVKKHSLVPSSSSSSCSSSLGMTRKNVPLSEEERASVISSFQNKTASIAIRLKDSLIDEYFPSVAEEIKKRLSGSSTKKSAYEEKRYKQSLEKGIDDFFKEKNIQLSDCFKTSPYILFMNQDEKAFCKISMNNAGNGVIINTNPQILKDCIEDVDKVTLNKGTVSSQQTSITANVGTEEKQTHQNKMMASNFISNLLMTNSLSEDEKNIVEELPSLFSPGKVPYATILTDSKINEYFGDKVAKELIGRLSDSKKAEKLDINHWSSLQIGAGKIFKDNKTSVKDFFAKNEFAVFLNNEKQPLFAIYRSNRRKASSDELTPGDLTLSVNASLIRKGLELRRQLTQS